MANTQVDTSDEAQAVSLRRPYMKVFSSIDGCFEHELTEARTTVGRSDESDIKFPDSTVSREHAVIVLKDDSYIVKDRGSYQGTKVNGKSIHNHVLQHGDSIQISMHVLQFKAHTSDTIAPVVSAKAKRMLHGEFHLLPSTMELSYRFVGSGSESIFKSGDTLTIGQGGLLVPACGVPDDATCVELRLTWPDRRDKRFLAEILGVIPEEGIDWMCLKLHRASKEMHEKLTGNDTAGKWVSVKM